MRWKWVNPYCPAVELERCYQLLDLEPGATLDQIKISYREQVKIFHPDRFAGDPKLQYKTQEKLKSINLAYERLCQLLEGASQFHQPFPAEEKKSWSPPPASPRAERAGTNGNSLGMQFVPVPGTSVMFSIWETRVQDYCAYASVVGGVDASWQHPGFEQDAMHPVVKVSWEEARRFCAWFTESERRAGRMTARQEFRLPTDEEWSWAVGIGDKETGATPADKDKKLDGVFPWGSPWPPPEGAGNYGSLLGVDKFGYTSPVGTFKANQHGLYDLGGNVWEWCEDLYDGKDGTRVLRGASWDGIDPFTLLASNRDHFVPGGRDDGIGFRCVLAGS